MRDTEEPPTKVTKFEMDSQFLEGDAEEGQEEWLSEGILTDDDYNPGSQQSQPETGDSMITNQEETTKSELMEQQGTDQSMEEQGNSSEIASNTVGDSNIEQTLNNFENEQVHYEEQDFPDELETFLIRKSDGATIGPEPVKNEGTKRQSAKSDDGNDTDDLLRVLGDEDQSNKGTKEGEASSDDDEYIFQGKKLSSNLQAAKNALLRAAAAKAEPEDDNTDCSSDEVETVKKVYAVKSNKESNTNQTSDENKPTIVQKSHIGKVVIGNEQKKVPQPTAAARSTVKQLTKKSVQTKPVTVNREVIKAPSADGKKPQSLKKQDSEVSGRGSRQQMMSPEQMDEEVPTDGDSDEDEDSLYDELPSSDSENIDDWFSLDIRAERAGDYLPLLGDQAYQLLMEEKARVALTLKSLKKSLSAMTDSGKEQADKLKEATATVAEIDAMLKAA